MNQNQTYRHEVSGGYLWSPKKKKNGGANPFYDFMREVAPGDVVFSFADTYIKAIGIARSHGYESPKPVEFGTTGAYWEMIGWRVDVAFTAIRNPTRPSDHMPILAPLLPGKYAPLRPNGDGLQSVYLTRLPEELAGALIDLIGSEAHALVKGYLAQEPAIVQPAIGVMQWEEHELELISSSAVLVETEKQAIVLARRGQGLFKSRVMSIEDHCRVTGVNRPEHLRASHCKPWRVASNNERLDGENGLLLTPSIDHLFDRGFVSFEDDGTLLVSPVAHADSLRRMGVNPDKTLNVGGFSEGQRRYLAFHRENEFLRSRYLDSC
ncbi:MAG: HNH endonuclease [Lysobacter sp.]|nr:HNH endonuclease [Lysobacter sp.]